MTQFTAQALFHFPNSKQFYSIKGNVVKGIQNGFVVAPFIGAAQTISGTVIKATNADFSNFQVPKSAQTTEIQNEAYSEIEYKNLVHQLATGLRALEKVVLSRKQVSKGNFKLKNVLQDLVNIYPKAFVYAFQLTNDAIWIGATPETILKKSGNRFSTHSLAGTKTTSESWTQKEITEQAIVSEYIQQQLTKTSVNNLKSTKPFTAKAGNIEHLKSIFTWTGKEPIEAYINTLHPTPAVCGFPLAKSFKTIANVEKHKREYYTGYIGIKLNSNLACLFVNLRCAKLRRNEAHVFAGGGLTQASDPNREWEETQRKMAPLLNILS